MKFGFIAKHRGIWPVLWMCEALGVSRGGFYAWLTRPRSQRSRDDDELGAKVRASFLGSDRTYGARRVWRDLLTEGISCGLHRIERLMRLQDGVGPIDPRDSSLFRANDRLPKSWPELQIRLTQLARESLRRQAWPTSGEVVTGFQSDSSRTDSPVRVLHAATQSSQTGGPQKKNSVQRAPLGSGSPLM